MSWAWFNKTSATQGVDLITAITFPTPAQLFPQTSNSGLHTGTHASLKAQGIASSDQTSTVKLKKKRFNVQLNLVVHHERGIKHIVVCLWACKGKGVGWLPFLLCICQHCVCVCVCVCPCQLSVICLSSPCTLICCQGPAASPLCTSYSFSPFSMFPSASSNTFLHTERWKRSDRDWFNVDVARWWCESR